MPETLDDEDLRVVAESRRWIAAQVEHVRPLLSGEAAAPGETMLRRIDDLLIRHKVQIPSTH